MEPDRQLNDENDPETSVDGTDRNLAYFLHLWLIFKVDGPAYYED